MSRNTKLRALMSIPAIEGRKAVARGETYTATEQEAREDERMGRGERIEEQSAAEVSKPPKAKS